MNLSTKTKGVGLAGLVGALALVAAMSVGQAPAQADAPAAAPQMVDDFRLPDQNLLGRQLLELMV